MPNKNLTNNITFISAEDLSQKLDYIDNINDKLSFAEKYILSYDNSQEDSGGLIDIESIVIAKNKIAEAMIKNKTNNNDKIKRFVGNPLAYLKDVIDEKTRNASIDKITSREYNLVKHIESYIVDYVLADDKLKNRDYYKRIMDKLPFEQRNVDVQVRNNKGGFFEKLFRTTSNQYREFETEFKKIGTDSSNRNSLERTSWAYLKHKFPNLKEGKLPLIEQIEALKGAGKGRAYLALKVYCAINEQKNQPKVDRITIECNNFYKNYIKMQNEEKNNQIINEQVKFQNDLSSKVSEEIDANKNIDNVISNEIKTNEIEM